MYVCGVVAEMLEMPDTRCRSACTPQSCHEICFRGQAEPECFFKYRSLASDHVKKVDYAVTEVIDVEDGN